MSTIQLKRGLAANLPAIGQPGEPFYDTENHKLYVAGADGVVRPLTVDAADLDGMGYDAVHYVSKTAGTAAGTGTYTNPYNSIAAAVAAMGEPTDLGDFERHHLIYVVDSEQYSADLVIGHRKVTISGAGFTIDGNVTVNADVAKAFGSAAPEAYVAVTTSVPNADARDARSRATAGVGIVGDVAVTAKGDHQFALSFSGVNVGAAVIGLTHKGQVSAKYSRFNTVSGGRLTVVRAEGVDVVGAVNADRIETMTASEIGGSVTVTNGAGVLRGVEFAAGATGKIGGATLTADASTIRSLNATQIDRTGVEIVPLETGEGVGYDPATSGLTAKSVQTAIDELYVDTRTIDGGTF